MSTPTHLGEVLDPEQENDDQPEPEQLPDEEPPTAPEPDTFPEEPEPLVETSFGAA